MTCRRGVLVVALEHRLMEGLDRHRRGWKSGSPKPKEMISLSHVEHPPDSGRLDAAARSEKRPMATGAQPLNERSASVIQHGWRVDPRTEGQ